MSYWSLACYTSRLPAASSFLAQGGLSSRRYLFFDNPCWHFIFIIIIKSPFLKLMKSLSRYDEREDPVVLRQDFVKEHSGVGYYGAKLKNT